ncbi:MAG TPA: T9SS type A sorting domain-containing protein, partial [Chitinophagaceae bacterium]
SPYAATYSYVATARNITVNNNSMSFGSTNDSLFAAGTLTIQNNGIINMATGGKIELQGNWNDQVNTAGKGFLNGTGTVIFSGAANQTITAVKGTELFYNLKINKTSTTGLVVLNNNITVDYDLTLTRGIFVTGYNLFTWNNNGGTLSSPGSGPGGSGSGLYTDSYIATSEGSGTPINVGGPTTPFAANAGFKIKNVGNTNTYFPVGASYLSSTTGQPPSPNRMMINNPGVPQDFTVAVNYGDIGFTNGGAGALKVNRIWYVKGSLGTGMVNMQLFFTKRDWTGWGTNENEVESGFDYTQPALVQKDYSGNQNNFINLSSTGDITSFAGAPYNTEIYGKYTIGISSTLTNGIQQFNRFSIVNPSSIILPVKFVGFKAYQNGNEVRIDWTAVNEINVHHYEIEKSTDGVRFTTIDRVDIIKNSTYANYRKTDPSPAFGNNFYRIRAIDKDGAVTYTSIELVNIAGKTYVTIYPNPVQNGIVNLYFTNLPAGNYDFILYNTLGQPILNRKIEHQGGSATQSFRLPTNAISGSYIVKLLNNTFDFTGRIVID